MNRLTIVASLNSISSYGLHAIQIVRGLKARGIHPSIRVISRAEMFGEPLPADVTAYVVKEPQPEEWELLLHPHGFRPTPGKKTAYYVAHESTRLPPKSVKIFNACDLVLTPSRWCETVLSAAGVTQPIRVVPLGVNPAVFHYQHRPLGLFTFGTGGRSVNGGTRKGLSETANAFARAFPNEGNVRLRIKAFPDCQLGTVDDSRVEVIRAFMPEQDLAKWYGSLDAFVSCSKGEGWGLMQHEAMACGRPVIGTAFGGVCDFFNADNGMIVQHRLVPGEYGYTGLGHWSEPLESDLIEKMRWAFCNRSATAHLGMKAHLSVERLTWNNSIDQLVTTLDNFGALEESSALMLGLQFSPPARVPRPRTAPVIVGDPIDDLTVAITSFKRLKHLNRAIASAVNAGVKNVVVATMEPDDEILRLLEWWKKTFPLRTAIVGADLGCNELWLRAAYHARTPRVLILHDDDTLDPGFGEAYRKRIRPALDINQAVTWRGALLRDDGHLKSTEYWDGETRVMPASDLERFLLRRKRLSLSPIVTVFDRDRLISALKESKQHLTHPHCLYRPGMLLGTEVLAHLRNTQARDGWLYLNEVLSYYGAHDGSGTVAAEKSGELDALCGGYDRTREHYENNRRPTSDPERRLILIFNDYPPRDEAEELRFSQARATWDFHFQQGELMELPVAMSDLPRNSSDLGDERPVPYVKDLIEFGMGMTRPEDALLIINRDLCLTTRATDLIRANLSKGIACCMRRDMRPIPTGRLFRSVQNCKKDGGYDLFAITPAWWTAHREKMPDMLLGREAWDTCLRMLAQEISGNEVYLDDTSYHSAHVSHWQRTRTSNAGQIHARRLAKEFFKARNNVRMVEQLS